MQGIVSTKCDVYSYGILLMETFTRTKPTDAMFDGDLSLKRWVDDSTPNAMIKIVDANLLRANQEHYAANVQCVSSIMELALRCSAESPADRMNVKDALTTLKNIRHQYLNNCQQNRGRYLFHNILFAILMFSSHFMSLDAISVKYLTIYVPKSPMSDTSI